jgi:hypothetical protein
LGSLIEAECGLDYEDVGESLLVFGRGIDPAYHAYDRDELSTWNGISAVGCGLVIEVG